jgi:hypothetical protein
VAETEKEREKEREKEKHCAVTNPAETGTYE